jgi:hypothetical protein
MMRGREGTLRSTMVETARAHIESRPRLSAVTSAAQERKIGGRWLGPSPDHAGRIVRLRRLPLAAITWVVLGLVVLSSVLAWLVIVPVLDLVVESFGRARRLLGGPTRR